jgi:hypothetical protein
MTYLIIGGIIFLLLIGFLITTLIENRKGVRYGTPSRSFLDAHVSKGLFIIKHVDWGSFFKHTIKASLEGFAHEVAHTSLMFVRVVERFLTRMVRKLRIRRQEHFPFSDTSSVVPESRSKKILTSIQDLLYRSKKKYKENMDSL